MQLHEIKPKHKLKKSKRVGRGGKRGTYCGKGIKGQKSRAGAKIRPELRDLVKKIPKVRGYKFNPKEKKLQKKKRPDKIKEALKIAKKDHLSKRRTRKIKTKTSLNGNNRKTKKTK